MATAGDKQARILALLLADPWRKLAAIGLAFLLWLYLDNEITDAREPTLRLQTANSPDEQGDKGTLLVVVDRSRHFVNGYYDRLTGEPINELRLTLRGAKHLIQDFDDESRGFRVTPAVGEGARTIEFSAGDVRAVVPKLQELIVGMTPESVRVDLVENTRRDVPLSPQIVHFEAPAEIEARLLADAAVFSTKAVWLLGPAPQADKLQALSKIFVAEVGHANASDTEVTGTLRLINNPNIDKLRFADDEPVTVTVPLRVPFQTYTVEVPYVLDQAALPSGSPTRFRPVETSAEIEVQVSHNLELLLDGMNDSDRREWMREHARLWVWLPPDAREDDVYTPQFLIVGEGIYTAGLDYRVVDLPLLRIERAP